MTASIVVTGEARVERVDAAYDLAALMSTAMTPHMSRWNPGDSPGASSVIRQLLAQSGVPYTIVAEVYGDGEQFGHFGGNALDVAPSSDVESVLRGLAPLFSCVASSALFIWDGSVQAPGFIGSIGVQFVNECVGHIHIASSLPRLINAMTTNSTVRNTLQSPTGLVDEFGNPLTYVVTDIIDPVVDDSFSVQEGVAAVDAVRTGDW